MDLWIFFDVAERGANERGETPVNGVVTQDPLPDRRYFGSTFTFRSALGWRGRRNSLNFLSCVDFCLGGCWLKCAYTRDIECKGDVARGTYVRSSQGRPRM